MRINEQGDDELSHAHEIPQFMNIIKYKSNTKKNSIQKFFLSLFFRKIKYILILSFLILSSLAILNQKKNDKHLMKKTKTDRSTNRGIKDEINNINDNILQIMKKFGKRKSKTINKLNQKTSNSTCEKLLRFLNISDFSEPSDENSDCKNAQGFYNFKLLKKSESYVLCNGENNKHICHYKYDFGFEKGGALCELENVILDPTKFNYYNKCPDSDFCPDISDSFFNMKCKEKGKQFSYHFEYDFYFKHWNYDYEKNNDKIEEIGKNKTVLIISSRISHLYHGFLEVMNAIAVMHVYELNPENVQILLIEKCPPRFDMYYPFYTELISRGGEIIYMNKLDKSKKYLIKHAINVPHLYDSPFWQDSTLPNCKYRSPAYKRLMNLIAKYLPIPQFYDSLDYNDSIIRYSSNIKNVNGPKYTKFVTIQWRKPYPPYRKDQERLMGNGPELLNKLQQKVKNNILVRLVDTAYLTIVNQISLMLKTDYFVGIHGAGFTLGPYLMDDAIIHEISLNYYNNMPLSICALSGHKTYKETVSGHIKNKDGEYIFLNANEFVDKILAKMKYNNF